MFDKIEDLVPISKFEIMAYVLAVVGIIAAIFFAGWTVNGWRLDAAHASAIAERQAEITELKSKIQAQNSAVDILDEKSKNAIARRQLAEQYSQQLVKANNKREAIIEGSKATDCDSYVRDMWGSW